MNSFKIAHMAAFLTLSSSRTIALADYFPTGQQLFSSVASLQHPPCSSFVPEQHLAPQHPPFIFLRIYIQSSYNNYRIIKNFWECCTACTIIIMESGDHIGLKIIFLIF